jgi:hypothetical protein
MERYAMGMQWYQYISLWTYMSAYTNSQLDDIKGRCIILWIKKQ